MWRTLFQDGTSDHCGLTGPGVVRPLIREIGDRHHPNAVRPLRPVIRDRRDPVAGRPQDVFVHDDQAGVE